MRIVFTKSSSLLSRLIRFVTRSEVSHVGLELSLEGLPVFLHADVGGVQISTKEQFFAGRASVASFRLDAPLDHRAAVGAIGDRYGYVDLVGHLLRALLKWVGYSYKRPLSSPRAMVCSELVARLPIPAFSALDPENTTPQELLEVCLVADGLKKEDVSASGL